MGVEWALILAAAGLGLAYSAAPGAVNTEALRRGLSRGYRPALLVQVGAAATVGWGRRFVGAGLIRWIGALSGLALGYFGLRLLWETLAAVLERPSSAANWARRAFEVAWHTREARRAAA